VEVPVYLDGYGLCLSSSVPSAMPTRTGRAPTTSPSSDPRRECISSSHSTAGDRTPDFVRIGRTTTMNRDAGANKNA
jgi:hypothetical protein